jgi:hypothetical protein
MYCKILKTKIYKITILPAVLYGLEACSLKLREEYRLGVFQNTVLERICEPREIIGQ